MIDGPEGIEFLKKAGNVTAWLERMRARDGVKAVLAPEVVAATLPIS